MAEKKVSIADLNIAKKCEDGYEFEYLDEAGKGTGIHFTVIGAHAKKVQDWVNKQLNQRRRQEAMQAKRGKDDVRPIEDDIDFGVELVSMRIVGWRGIAEEHSPELALTLCQGNPLVVEQVKEASENLANFTKSK